jgi:hypothetical protein
MDGGHSYLRRLLTYCFASIDLMGLGLHEREGSLEMSHE